MDSQVKNIQVDLNLRPSARLGRQLILTLFDHLLHSRSQIPFHFELFKKFIEVKAKPETREGNWKTEKQLKLAAETYEKICAVKEILETNFIGGTPILILFGSTIHTAKESYQILFPSINELILPTLINETTAVRKILLTIIESDELKPSAELTATNVFILFKLPKSTDKSDLVELRTFKLSRSCRKFSIEFHDSSDFAIFEEFQDLSLKCSDDRKGDEVEDNVWYQSKTFVKGFKDILVNEQSIWK